MPESVKPNNENLITLKSTPGSNSDSESVSAILSWISDQLTRLAEGFGEPLTEERVMLYVGGLKDIPQNRLQVAFQRALYELTYFPRLAELRNLAGATVDEQKKVEANAAWDHVNKYLRTWGVDLLPTYSDGKRITAPPLNSRVEYALRRIGGLRALNQVDVEKLPFMYRDFCEAYTLAPVAELLNPQLSEQFGDRALIGNVKRLTENKTMEPQTTKSEPQSRQQTPTNELTPERKAELRQKLDEELAKHKNGHGGWA